jgi:hypothetical protein
MTNFENAAEIPTLGPEFANMTISHATLRTEDIIQAILNFLATSSPENIENEVWEIEQNVIIAREQGNDEELDFILHEDAFPLMNAIAPEDNYFGAHPGDGSDIGFWQIEDEGGV